MILIYLMHGFVSVAPSVQNILIQVFSTVTFGYIGALLVKLYRIQAVLLFVVVFCMVIVIYLYMVKTKRKSPLYYQSNQDQLYRNEKKRILEILIKRILIIVKIMMRELKMNYIIVMPTF